MALRAGVEQVPHNRTAAVRCSMNVCATVASSSGSAVLRPSVTENTPVERRRRGSGAGNVVILDRGERQLVSLASGVIQQILRSAWHVRTANGRPSTVGRMARGYFRITTARGSVQ